MDNLGLDTIGYSQDRYREPRQPSFVDTLLGPLDLVTAPTAVAVATDEIREWCRVDDTRDDALLDRLITRATRYCENEVSGQRQIMTATWDVPIRGWWQGPLKLPRPPLQQVSSISYYDSGATVQTLSTSLYLVRTPWRQPGTIERAPGESWPALETDRRYPITVRFVAGWTVAALPESVKSAILLCAAWWFDNRASEMPEGMVNTLRNLVESEGWGSYS